MCFSADASLFSFMFGLLSSILLIRCGNKQSIRTNYTIGYFFMFVSLMQLIEYSLWNDQECQCGINRIGSIFGPIFNHLQPVIFLILANIFIKSAKIVSNKILIITNILYLCYVSYKYIEYIGKPENLCTFTNADGHLDWNWKRGFNYLFYFSINLINIINYCGNINVLMSMIFSYLLLFTSILNFNKNIGEIWCLLVTGVPLVNLVMQRIFNINN